MAYKQIKKFGYRDALDKGDPEKVIYGQDFDDEFEAIENSFDGVPGAGGEPITPETPGFEQVVFQNKEEDQQVVSKFTFTSEKLGDEHGTNRFVVDPSTYTAQFLAGSDAIGSDSYNNWNVELQGSLTVTSMGFPPFSMAYSGMGMQRSSDAYVRHYWAEDPDNPANPDPQPERWVVKPGLDVEGDITVSGNITIDGGSIIDGDGNSAEGMPEGEDGHMPMFFSSIDKWVATDKVSYNKMENAIEIIPVWVSSPGVDPAPFMAMRVSKERVALGEQVGLRAYWLEIKDENYLLKAGIEQNGDAYFSGTVTANDYVGDGSALTGMYSGADAVKTSGAQTISGIKTFNSDIRCKANVYAYYGSDERLKDEIGHMPLGLIDDIDPSTWKWKEDGRWSGGVIAQQLQQIGLDDWVRESPEGELGVDYNALIGMLIAEVQELKKQVNEK